MGATVRTIGDYSVLVFLAYVSGKAPGPEQQHSFIRKYYNDYMIMDIALESGNDETNTACQTSVLTMSGAFLEAVSFLVCELWDRPTVDHIRVPRVGAEIALQ